MGRSGFLKRLSKLARGLSLRKNDMLNRRIAMEIVRERFGAEALRALEDLERASAKEAKEEKADVKLTLPKICYDFNRTAGCSYKNCQRIHKGLGCGAMGHMIFDCPAKKKS